MLRVLRDRSQAGRLVLEDGPAGQVLRVRGGGDPVWAARAPGGGYSCAWAAGAAGVAQADLALRRAGLPEADLDRGQPGGRARSALTERASTFASLHVLFPLDFCGETKFDTSAIRHA
jgi:hypothetical protein